MTINSDWLCHEIRNPLHAIKGAGSLLAAQSTDSKTQELLAAILTASEQIESLLAYLNSFDSKFAPGFLQIEPTDLAHCLKAIHTICKPQAEAKGLKLHFELSPHLPAKIQTDPTRLRQILLNLISNAIKFSDAKEVTTHVGPDTSGRIAFHIHDQGRGLPSEHNDHLFHPHTQAAPSDRQQGKGLGLAISKHLVEALGGSIGAINNPDQGATFWFTITPLPITKPLAIPTARTTITSRHVLVVDDDPLSCFVVGQMLESLQGSYESCHDGQTAWQTLQNQAYQWVIVDGQLPDMPGAALIEKIRLSGLNIPVLALAGSNCEKASLLAAGANSFFLKPISRSQLAAALTIPEYPAQTNTEVE